MRYLFYNQKQFAEFQFLTVGVEEEVRKDDEPAERVEVGDDVVAEPEGRQVREVLNPHQARDLGRAGVNRGHPRYEVAGEIIQWAISPTSHAGP